MRLDLDREGKHWPHRKRSERIQSSGFFWHIQRWIRVQPSEPHTELQAHMRTIVLIHGTGASLHSWADLAPLLALQFNVIAMDLPGHGFSDLPGDTAAGLQKMSLIGMANGVLQLLSDLRIEPDIVVGHSAGAAIAMQMNMQRTKAQMLEPLTTIAVNGALLPFGSYNMPGMSLLTKFLSKNRLIPKIFSVQAHFVPLVDFLLDSTGSQTNAASKACYQTLISNSEHARGALVMMAQWDLKQFARQLPLYKAPLILLACTNDKTVAPGISEQVNALLPDSQLVRVPALGHIGHEEKPALFLQLITDCLATIAARQPN